VRHHGRQLKGKLALVKKRQSHAPLHGVHFFPHFVFFNTVNKMVAAIYYLL